MNFRSLREIFLLLLKLSANAEDYTLGAAEANAEAIKSWKSKDIEGRNILFSTVDSNHQRCLVNCDTSFEMWTRLSTQQVQNSVYDKTALQTQFFNYQYKSGSNVLDHITEIETLSKALNDIGVEITESQLVAKIVGTLPTTKFRSFISSWDGLKDKNKTIGHLTSRLLKEEALNKECETNSNTNEQVFYSKDSHYVHTRGRGGKRPYNDRSKTFCNYCRKPYHIERHCRKKIFDDAFNQGKEAAQRKEKVKIAAANSNSSETIQDNCYYISSTLSETKRSRSKEHTVAEFSLSTSFCFLVKNPNIWYADSGATQHMSDQLHAFTEFHKIVGTVTGIGGFKLKVEGTGNIDIVSKVDRDEYAGIIENVLYVPNLGVNLLSIASVTSTGREVHFVKDKVIFWNKGVIEMTGRRVGNTLYELDIDFRNKEKKMSLLVKGSNLIIWHQRLAHLNFDAVLKLSNGVVDGLDILSNEKPPTESCEGCILGKMHRLPFPCEGNKATSIGDLVHSDICGPMQVSTPNGGKYFAIFKDDFSSWCVVHILKQKSDVASLFTNFVASLRKETGKEVRTLRSDNGGEYCNTQFGNWLREMGIRHETSAPHTPQQNGVSERTNRTIMDAARSQMQSTNTPLCLWGEAVVSTVHVQNRSLVNRWNVTPYESWYGKKPNISHFKVFGARAFAHVPDQNRQKLDAKAQKCIFVGYAEGRKAYRLWNPVTQKIVISRDVIVEEKGSESIVEENFDKDLSTGVKDSTPGEQPEMRRHPVWIPLSGDEDEQEETQPNLWRAMQNTMEIEECPVEPSTYEEAVNGPDADKWIPAIREEYDSLMTNRTWTLCELPNGREAIKGKWILKFKPGYKEVQPRYKARFVAKGYSQIYGLDYVETFSPVVKHTSFRVILSLAAAYDLEMIQLDIKTAFLYGELEEEIYMMQPEGFVIPGKENHVCRLTKSIYGLKQASRAWNKKFHDFIMIFGLVQSKADSCVYFRHQRKGEEVVEFTILIIYVDDGIIFSNKPQVMTDILEHLKRTFEVKSFSADRFLGVNIIRDRKLKTINICQPEYILKILKRFNMLECNPLSTPADPNSRLSPDMSPTTEEQTAEMESKPYKEAVGSLMHVMVMTRPDIAFAVNQVAQYSKNPGKAHWKAVKRILAYLHKTKDFGLHFDGKNNNSLIGYCDADYAGCLATRRSTSGVLFINLGGTVSWSSRRQRCTAQSTTEAEFVAASEAAKEAVWLIQLLLEFGKENKPSLLCDNQSAIALVKNPVFHQRTKHIDVRVFYIREVQEKGIINIDYISTEHQLADILTKALPTPRFEKLRENIGVIQIST